MIYLLPASASPTKEESSALLGFRELVVALEAALASTEQTKTGGVLSRPGHRARDQGQGREHAAKNLLVAKDDALQAKKHNKWKAIPAEQRSVLKA